MATWQLPTDVALWIAHMASALHGRLAFRLGILFTGLLFARGRRTVTSWLRAAGIGKDYKSYYYFLGSLGRNIKLVGGILLAKLRRLPLAGDRVLLAVDDSPTQRYGPCVEGAGLHHNPTPGPAAQKFVYGHVWVTVALVVRHALWGSIGLPLWALLYVRRKDSRPLRAWYRVKFRTKLEMAAELVQWAVDWLQNLGKAVWVVADGAYAKRPFLQRVLALGVVVVSRLRKDAALWSLPKPKPAGRRGPQARYGAAAIDLAKRAGQKRGWQTGTFTLYGKETKKKYKTFLATYKPVGGVIRVVLVQERKSWVAFFCTQADATVAQILEAYADRAALEQVFHDIKEVHGAGQQQLRNYWANLGAFNLTLWSHTLIELWAWDQGQKRLADRSASPWDKPERRPSHGDRLKALRRQSLEKEIPHADLSGSKNRRLKKLVKRLVQLAG
jgi:DDE superfamily endonuclease